MLTCPICGAAIDQITRVCPVCSGNLAGTNSAHGERSSSNGSRIVVAVMLLAAIAVVALVGLWIADGRTAARRVKSESNLKHIVLGIHNYYDANGGRFPVTQFERGRGTTAHGWQMSIVGFMDKRPVLPAIDFEEPWDAPANSAFSTMEIPVYLNPGISDTVDARGYPLIHYAGNVHVLGRTPALTFPDITDGSSNTILIGEVVDGLRAWADPRNLRDPALGLNLGPLTFGSPWKGIVHFASADGAVHAVDTTTPIARLKALATPDGGEFEMPPDG